MAEPVWAFSGVAPATRRGADKRKGAAALLTSVTHGISIAREIAPLRERFEEELRVLVDARSIVLRDEPDAPAASNVMCFDVPGTVPHHRARIEAIFEPARRLDGWTCQLLESATHVAALLLEIERARGRPALSVRGRTDGAAPLIGSSSAICGVRQRIERVAATDFTVLIEGAIGPQPHPSFIGFFCETALGHGDGEVERAGEDAPKDLK